MIDGPLGTDRANQLKVNWTYITPWDLEVGGFFRVMGGTPISRTVDLEHVDIIVDNRGSDGRNPTWTQTDLSLVQRFYPFPDETKSFEINFNVINLFNQKTALRTFRNLYRQSLPLWQPGDPVSQVLNGYDYQAIATSQGATQDPRFLQEDRFPGSDHGPLRNSLRLLVELQAPEKTPRPKLENPSVPDRYITAPLRNHIRWWVQPGAGVR